MDGDSGVTCGLDGSGGSGFHRLGVGVCGEICGLDGDLWEDMREPEWWVKWDPQMRIGGCSSGREDGGCSGIRGLGDVRSGFCRLGLGGSDGIWSPEPLRQNWGPGTPPSFILVDL